MLRKMADALMATFFDKYQNDQISDPIISISESGMSIWTYLFSKKI